METTLAKPRWAGNDLLSQFVNWLIGIKPLYGLMRQQARRVLIRTAERNGVPWRSTVAELDIPEARSRLLELNNPEVCYPDYYRVPFHAYPLGNLCWLAAFEATPATYAMALRVWPQEQISWQDAQQRLRESFLQVLAEYGPAEVKNVLDIGCSVGISTLSLHRFYQQRQTTRIRTIGLDLSPFMLAVAKLRDEHREIAGWIHRQAEKTDLPDNYFEIVTLQFVLHELPQLATREIFQECLRILKPGGCLAIVDNNPRSPVIQKLSPVLFTLMKSTEPWSDEYYPLEVEVVLQEVGFEHLTTCPSDPRHRTIVARKPGSAQLP
jgi:ubiquinone/menaquinone biosynthesis C-methylase UbiE